MGLWYVWYYREAEEIPDKDMFNELDHIQCWLLIIRMGWKNCDIWDSIINSVSNMTTSNAIFVCKGSAVLKQIHDIDFHK